MRDALWSYPSTRSAMGLARALRRALSARGHLTTRYFLDIAELHRGAPGELAARVGLSARTSVEVMALFQELNDEGVTIVLVTHEHDIADYHKRVVEFRDGGILRDHPVQNRLIARQELAKLENAELEGVA